MGLHFNHWIKYAVMGWITILFSFGVIVLPLSLIFVGTKNMVQDFRQWKIDRDNRLISILKQDN